MMQEDQGDRRRCGVCEALTRVFRRIMCIGPPRRGSQESYYTHLQQNDPLAGVPPTLETTTDPAAILVSIPQRCLGGKRSSLLTEEDVVLLAGLGGGGGGRGAQGRFLTMHKRRRRRLTTRALQEAPALLDDIHHGQVECVLDRVWQWPFNAFTLDTATGGRSLPVLCVHLFHWYGLMDHFNLDVVRIWKFFSLVEEGYHSTNPYHNAIHATDVTQAMHCFLQEEKIKEHLTPLEVMSALIAAVTHDLDHPGVNQPFLIATSNHLAALYENTSVLENHHWRSAVGCLLESHLAEQLTLVRPELEKQISSLILATDITRQQEFLTRFKKYLDEGTLDMRRPENRHFILQIALKCADISNPCRPWDVSRKWSQKVCEEFFRQGDYERQLNLPVTSLCDRHTTSIPKIQAGFFRFVVAPLFEEWHRFLDTGLSHSMMHHLRSNQAKWETMIQQELAEETRTEISEAEELPDEVDENDGRRVSLPTVEIIGGEVSGGGGERRRHSVPLGIKRAIPCTIVKGESISGAGGGSGGTGGEPRRRFTLCPVLHFEEDEEVSIGSSWSGSGVQRSSAGSPSEERPVSAENLLPEPSIASITSSSEAGRLSSVLQGNLAPPQARLTRQQTFPPLQPYVRVRYMSTTAEMQGSVSSSDSTSSSNGGGEGGIIVGRTLCESDCSGGKRDCHDESNNNGDRSSGARGKCREKENVDPDSKQPRRALPQSSVVSLCRRRGSAPVSLAPETSAALRGISRRGSVPTDTSIVRQSVLKPLGFNENSGLSMPRRSSLPYELARQATSPPFTHPPEVRVGGGAEEEGRKKEKRGGSRGGSRRFLKRRSSGGPEIFTSCGMPIGRRRSLDALLTSLTGRSHSFKETIRH